MNNETEQIFLLNAAPSQPSASTQKLGGVEIPGSSQVNLEDVEDFSHVCRTCATITEFVIPIFAGEGLQNNLADKIHKHLPIQVCQADVLPRVVCYQCASTLLAWHELVQCCVQADIALRARLPTSRQEAKPLNLKSSSNIEEESQSKFNITQYVVQALEPPQYPEPTNHGPPVQKPCPPDQRPCTYCPSTHAHAMYQEHLVTAHSDLLFYCEECDKFIDRKDFILHMSLHAVQYTSSQDKKELRRKVRKKKEEIDVNQNTEVSETIENNNTVQEPNIIKSNESQQNEFSDHSDMEYGFGPLPESVFEAIEDSQDSQPLEEDRSHTPENERFSDESNKSIQPMDNSNLSNHTITLESSNLSDCALPSETNNLNNCALPAETNNLTNCTLPADTDNLVQCALPMETSNLSNCSLTTENNNVTNCALPTESDIVNNCALPMETDIISNCTLTTETDNISNCALLTETNNLSNSAQTLIEINNIGNSASPLVENSNISEVASPHIEVDTVSEPILQANNHNNSEGETKKENHKKTRTCPICSKVYTASSSYFYHMKYFHKGSREHECKDCNKKFGTRASLTQHMAIHTGQYEYECKQCKKQFKSKASLYIHEQTHNGKKSWSCNQCHTSFRWRTHLFRHMTRHSAEKHHVCTTCGRGFSIRCDLLRHTRTHNAGSFTCDKCDLKFAQLRYLKVHMVKKHSASIVKESQ